MTTRDIRLRWIALGLVALVTLLRILVAAVTGLGDAEAYYWTWSRHLAASYLDHGPVVAYLIRLGTWLMGKASPLAIRLPFILVSGISLWLMALMGSRLFNGGWASGIWCVLGLLAMPVFQVAGGAANPDVPLIALVTGFMLALTRSEACSRDCLSRASLWMMMLAGLLAGLAVSCKLFALVLALPLVSVAWQHEHRFRQLMAAILCMALGSFPVLIWNAEHGWASVAYHLIHRHTTAPGPSLENLAKLVGGQLAYISPLVLVGLAASAVVLWRGRKQPPARLLTWIGASLLIPGYLLILVIPGAEPHWPVAGYLPLVVVLGHQLPRWYHTIRWGRILTIIALSFSAIVAAALHLHVLTDLGIRLMPASYVPRYDLSNELRGWPEVVDAVSRQIKRNPGLRIAACHYTSCSQLSFAARQRFEVLCPSPRLDQFDFFPGGDGSAIRDADLLYVKDERFPFDADRLYRCNESHRHSVVEIWRAGRVVRRFELQICRGFSGLKASRWPPGSPASSDDA